MLIFRFVYPVGYFPRHFLRQAFFARRGRLPMRSAVGVSEKLEGRGVLEIAVDWEEGGTIHVPFRHRRFGATFFSTETLRPRAEPFHLVRELARGQLSRVLKRFHEWQLRGLRVPSFVAAAMREGMLRMTELAVMDENRPDFDEKAVAVFESLVFLSQILLDQFVEQSLLVRKTLAVEFPCLVGVRSRQPESASRFTASHREFSHVFQAWNPGYSWRDIEPEEGVFRWELLDTMASTAKANHWRIFFGPLVKWDRSSLPGWILQRLDDPYSVRKALFEYAEKVIRRYPFVHHWIVAGELTSCLEHILVSKRIEWADGLARIIRSVNPRAKILVGIDRPWGDGLRFESELPPLELGDRLASNRHFDGFFLSSHFGFSHEATLPRDAFELNWLLDQWALLAKPLYFSFSIPSDASAEVPRWETPDGFVSPWDFKTQQEMVHRFFLSLLTRKSISGVFWDRLTDHVPKISAVDRHDFSGDDTKRLSDLSPHPPSPHAVPIPPPVSPASPPTLTPFVPHPNGEEVGTPLPPIPFGDSSAGPHLPPEIISLEEITDAHDLIFPYSGLLTADGKAKPAFRKLLALERAYLG